MGDRTWMETLREEMKRTGLSPRHVGFEITETAAMQDLTGAAHFVTGLEAAGFRLAIDDFGVGFSSFDVLRRLPVTYWKLHGSFVRELPTNRTDQHLVKAMVEMARAMGKQTIAEQVADGATLALLREYKVDAAQGEHIAMPRPLAELLLSCR